MAACILQGKTCVCAQKTFKPYAYSNAMLWWASSQVNLVIGCSSVYPELGWLSRRLLKMAAIIARENLCVRSKNFQTLRLPQCNSLVA